MSPFTNNQLSTIFTFIGIFLFYPILTSFVEETDVEFKKLKGPVKSFHEFNYQLRWDSTTAVFSLMRVDSANFNEEGNFLNMKRFKDIDRIIKYKLRESKMVNKMIDSISKLNQDTKNDNQYSAVSFCFYDKNNNRIEKRIVRANGWIEIQKYTESGELKEIITSSPKGHKPRETTRHKTIWLKNGNMKGYNYKNNKLYETVLHKRSFDKYGNWITDSIFRNDTFSYLVEREFKYWPKK